MTKTCPTCGRDTTRPASSNAQTHTYLDIPTGLVPAVVDALAIARNAALISSAPDARDGLEALRKTLAEEIPSPAHAFTARDWAALCAMAAGGAAPRTELIRKGSYFTPIWQIRIDAPARSIQSEPFDDEDAATALKTRLDEMMLQLAPLKD